MERKVSTAARQHERFLMQKKTFDNQFWNMYVARLAALEPTVRSAIAADPAYNATTAPILPKIIDLRVGDACVITGTVFKVLKNKPNLLDEFMADEVMSVEDTHLPLSSEHDELFLEDESGRVALTGKIDISSLVTGVVLGVQGEMGSDGEGFLVERIFLPAPAPQPAPLPQRQDDAYVALVSGLGLGSVTVHQHPLATALAIDYLAGRLVGSGEEKAFVASIVHTIVAGNSLSKPAKDVLLEPVKKSQSSEHEVKPLEQLDLLLASLAATMPVDILPGAWDPSNVMLPQQPLASCLLPQAMSLSTCQLVSNPYAMALDGVSFVGTSGQPVDSVVQCSQRQSPLDALGHMLEWRHLAPTAPDILSCYPSADTDVYVLDECPHVFFAGNQPEFQTKLVTGPQGQTTRLVCVPSFLSTGTIVLVNLRDLSCVPVTIAL
ncbi:DNA polymerase alpha/epsilon subunit B [Achlya hypogyna]|uniref:DNA polymerase alpha/epsilon subunit B n=1 Tax=Achlya hypogyna TaxID=1202772 RepID=A0A1V9Y4X6_ACHHY|nr:DNA polymerase alpha/epsilon subunit B [Achlya hypogyna]